MFVLCAPASEWLALNWVAVVGWFVAAGGWVSAAVAIAKLWSARRPRLHFDMWAVIEPASHHPREMLKYRFRNSGYGPVHIINIEGDNGFTLIDGDRDYFDPVTIEAHPEPFDGPDVPAPYTGFMKKRPSRVHAVDSTGKKWPLPKTQLVAIYKVFTEYRGSEEYAARGSCTCCDD